MITWNAKNNVFRRLATSRPCGEAWETEEAFSRTLCAKISPVIHHDSWSHVTRSEIATAVGTRSVASYCEGLWLARIIALPFEQVRLGAV